MRLFCLCIILCLGRGLAKVWSLAQGVLPHVKNDYGTEKWLEEPFKKEISSKRKMNKEDLRKRFFFLAILGQNIALDIFYEMRVVPDLNRLCWEKRKRSVMSILYIYTESVLLSVLKKLFWDCIMSNLHSSALSTLFPFRFFCTLSCCAVSGGRPISLCAYSDEMVFCVVNAIW
jgi:hypothetical protein